MTATARSVLAICLLVAAVAAVASAAYVWHERRPPPAMPAVAARVSPALDALPVLHRGRVKPYRVAGEELVAAITGRAEWGTADGGKAKAGDLVADLMLRPQAWRDQPLIAAPRAPLRAALGLETNFASVAQAESPDARALIDGARGKSTRADATGELADLTPAEAAALPFANAHATAVNTMTGVALGIAPLAGTPEQRAWVLGLGPALGDHAAGEAPWRDRAREIIDALRRTDGSPAAADRVWESADPWLGFGDLVLADDPLLAQRPGGAPLHAAGKALATALRDGGDLRASAADLAAAAGAEAGPVLAERRARGLAVPAWPSATRVGLELLYLQARPFTWAWIALIAGGVLAGIGLSRAERGRRWVRAGTLLTAIGAFCVAAGLAARVGIGGFAAVTNLYETVVFVALVCAVLGLVLTRTSGNPVYVVAAGIAGGLCAMVGEAMPPAETHVQQLQAVLRSRFWLWIHVKVIVASYAAFLLAWGLGNWALFRAVREGRQVDPALARGIYRALQVGVVLVAAGTLLGGVWADQAWGRFWGWDPKEVWALVILLVYLVPLHLRYVGAVGPTGLAAWSVAGFLSVVFSWYGVNFLLGAGLHAYATGQGFGESLSVDKAVAFTLSLAQIAVLVIQLIHLRGRGAGSTAGDETMR